MAAISAAFIVGTVLGVGGTIAVMQSGADEPVPVMSYEMVQNDRGHPEFTVWVRTGTQPVFTLWRVEEKSDRVEVSVRLRSPGGEPRTMEARITRLSWPLHEPLGSRRIVDMATGKDVAIRSRQVIG